MATFVSSGAGVPRTLNGEGATNRTPLDALCRAHAMFGEPSVRSLGSPTFLRDFMELTA
jgi:hypothetical protein